MSSDVVHAEHDENAVGVLRKDVVIETPDSAGRALPGDARIDDLHRTVRVAQRLEQLEEGHIVSAVGDAVAEEHDAFPFGERGGRLLCGKRKAECKRGCQKQFFHGLSLPKICLKTRIGKDSMYVPENQVCFRNSFRYCAGE